MEKLPYKDKARGVWIVVSMILAFCSLFLPIPNKTSIGQLSSLIVTTFSFLAGFLIAALAVVGYSTDVIARHGWQTAEHYRNSFETKLKRYALHFVIYLASIIFVMSWSFFENTIPLWLWRVSTFICTFSLFMAFSLPYEITSQHSNMYDSVVDNLLRKQMEEDGEKFGNVEEQRTTHPND